MMKKMMLLAFSACVLLWGCAKQTTACTAVNPANEESALVAYSAAQGFTTTKDASGMYYQIVTPGTGVRPTSSSQVTIQYVGKLFDGTTFDSNTSTTGATFYLSQLIQGWQIGLPLIKVGGKIRLVVPSAYAYGCAGSPPTIPANAPLFFEITLLAVN